MKKVIVLNSETNLLEEFYFSSNVSDECITDSLLYIKEGHSRDWRRVSRSVVSIETVDSFSVDMKYIKSKDIDNDEEMIIVFNKNINHDFMHQAFRSSSEEFCIPVSAGFTNGSACVGRSETLNKDSDPNDIKLFI